MPETAHLTQTIGFIGGGNMAEAIIQGVLISGTLSKEQVIASDISDKRRKSLSDTYRIETLSDNTAVVRRSDIIILAIKPQMAGHILQEIAPHIDETKLIISIVAGLTTATISGCLAPNTRIVRTMPNTPVLVQAGMVALSPGPAARPEDAAVAQAIFSPIARTITVDEKMMDAVVGLSASGPAYVFLMIDALAAGGVKMGLPRDIAQTLAAQTLFGAAKMCLETGKHPEVLRDMVTSPGGTTIAGIHALETRGVRAALMDAVEMATLRSAALGKLL